MTSIQRSPRSSASRTTSENFSGFHPAQPQALWTPVNPAFLTCAQRNFWLMPSKGPLTVSVRPANALNLPVMA